MPIDNLVFYELPNVYNEHYLRRVPVWEVRSHKESGDVGVRIRRHNKKPSHDEAEATQRGPGIIRESIRRRPIVQQGRDQIAELRRRLS